MTLRFDPRSLAFFVGLLAVEVMIALFVPDGFLRTFVGDVLVVVLIFYGIRAFLDLSTTTLALGVLAFSWSVEIAQYFDVVTRLGLDQYSVARIVIGSTFDPLDLLAYLAGCSGAYFFETRCGIRRRL